jgi:catechol 2,3-dioxygenase-like lactoylglutathione lyase family enzyme
MLTKLDHVTLAVLDIRAASVAYQALLGRAPLWRGTHPEVSTSAALFGLSNSVIELMGPSPEAPDAAETEALRSQLLTRGDGLQTLSFGTDDADYCTRTLRERGVRATPPQAGEARSVDGTLRSYRLVELSPRATRSLPVSIVERPEALAADPQGAADPGAFQALDHVLIASAELDQAVLLYRDQLGLRLALDTLVGGRRMLFFRLAGVTLEIIHDASQSAGDVFAGLAYRVGDLPAARERLLSAGLDVSELRVGNKPGTQVFSVRSGTHGVPTLVLRDPTRDGPRA